RFGGRKEREGPRPDFIPFTAEEKGPEGSSHYFQGPLFPLHKALATLNTRIIPRAKPEAEAGTSDKRPPAGVYARGTGDGFGKLVDDAGAKAGLSLTKLAGGTGPSDHDSFYRKKVPVLYLYTGNNEDYHRPSDVPEKLNYPGIKKVSDFVAVVADNLST